MISRSAPLEFRAPAGLTLRGAIWGEGPREAVFTHGNGFTVQTYRAALEPLVPRLRIHGINLRGHGGSDVPDEFPDWDGPFNDLVAYLRECCRTPALLIGHSYGATLSLRIAAQHPELAAGLILMEPLVLAGRDDPWPLARQGHNLKMVTEAEQRRERWPSRDDAAGWLRSRGSYSGWSDTAFAAFVETALVPAPDGGVQLACPPWLEARGYATLPDAIVFRWADRIRQPAVFLHGDRSLPPAPLEALARAIPISVVMSLKGTHTFPMEFPAQTGRALAAGLDIVLKSQVGGTVHLS
ncbi:MAG: alpha/beta fold hydrolase [SAR324 cluster bacterium]